MEKWHAAKPNSIVDGKPVPVRETDSPEEIERLEKQSNGGFGAYLPLVHDWAAPAAKLRCFVLFARHVVPRFQGQYQSTADARARARAARPALVKDNLKAVEQSTAKYQAELAAKGK